MPCSMTNTVNVTEGCSVTPGTFQIRAHYTETDAGCVFGPFASREAAEKCLLVVAERTDVKKAELEVVS